MGEDEDVDEDVDVKVEEDAVSPGFAEKASGRDEEVEDRNKGEKG